MNATIRRARHYLGALKAMRDEARTARFIAGLPSQIRKDIGWPDAYDARVARRR